MLLSARTPALLGTRREPDNPHDSNAIALVLSAEMVGYVPSRQAAWVAERIDNGGFVEIYLMGARRSGGEIDAEMLIVTSIFDAPDGTASAAEADRLAIEQIAEAERRKQDESITPPMTEAVAILQWLAVAGETEQDLADAVIDDFLSGELAARGWASGRERLQRLRKNAKSLKGSRQRANKAMTALTEHRDVLARLLPKCLAMAKADGTMAAGEADALRALIDRFRQSS